MVLLRICLASSSVLMLFQKLNVGLLYSFQNRLWSVLLYCPVELPGCVQISMAVILKLRNLEVFPIFIIPLCSLLQECLHTQTKNVVRCSKVLKPHCCHCEEVSQPVCHYTVKYSLLGVKGVHFRGDNSWFLILLKTFTILNQDFWSLCTTFKFQW